MPAHPFKLNHLELALWLLQALLLALALRKPRRMDEDRQTPASDVRFHVTCSLELAADLRVCARLQRVLVLRR